MSDVSVRHYRAGAGEHCGACAPFAAECQGLVPAKACVAHRCPEHAEVPPINDAGPEQSECALCVATTFVRGYEKAFEKSVFNPVVEKARDRLNLMAPGAGDQFVDEARAILNTAALGE